MVSLTLGEKRRSSNLVRKQFRYLPFARLLQRRIEHHWGRNNRRARNEAAKILAVPYMTLATWLVGNALPKTTERKFMLGVFLGWASDGEDEEGLKRTYEYFLGEEPKSTNDERAAHIRAKGIALSVKKRGRWERYHKRKKREERSNE